LSSRIDQVDPSISNAYVSDAGWGLTYTVNLIQKSQKVVTLQVACTRPNGQDMIPNSYNICTIPSGFRPQASNLYFSGFLTKSGDPNQRRAVSFEVRSDGGLKTGYGISTTGYDSMFLGCTYLTT